jgi:SAM-dependent methyltransferase
MALPDKYIAIDEEGYPLFGDVRVTDPNVGGELLEEIRFAENGAYLTTTGGVEAIVEPFDEPYVAAQVSKSKSQWKILLPYGFEVPFNLKTLTLDEWDRFHGLTDKGIPFVFSRKAQAEFFNLLDEFDDESITFEGEQIEIPPWLPSRPDVEKADFWTNIYQTEQPRWELEQPTPSLVDLLPRLKLPKSRILVLGCGSGNDAAYFAEQGHVVTAIDISDEALSRGRKKFSRFENIQWLQADLFKLGREHDQSYDVIFENTCFCAINPAKRSELVQIWRRLLAPGGFLMANLFVMEKRNNPPFGSTEWELRERLKKNFHFVFWGRWHQSIDRRNGKELLIYAQKKST